jgi:hypothetical protein
LYTISAELGYIGNRFCGPKMVVTLLGDLKFGYEMALSILFLFLLIVLKLVEQSILWLCCYLASRVFNLFM